MLLGFAESGLHQGFEICRMPVGFITARMATASGFCQHSDPQHRNPCMQEILEVVADKAADFDTVCMATALHRMAAFNAGPAHYEHIAVQPAFQRLLVMVGARRMCLAILSRAGPAQASCG